MRKIYLCILLGISITIKSVQADDYNKVNRQNLMNLVTDGVILIPSANNLSDWNSDKNFLYLTGFNAPKTILGLDPQGDKKEIIFSDDENNSTIPLDCQIEKQPLKNIAEFIKNTNKLYLPINRLNELTDILDKINIYRKIEIIENINPKIFDLRLIKKPEEINRTENAIMLTKKALMEAFRNCKSGSREVDIYALIQAQVIKDQVRTSFYQIASGSNSTNVHFDYTDRVMKTKETIVFDLGVFYKNYTSDISRTFPVDGKFTKEQKQIYSIVLNAQKVGISLMQPGMDFNYVEKKVKDELVKGVYELGLMTDSTSSWQKEFYIQHGFSHGIGLDVHDVYNYFKYIPKNKYLTGMIYTMEPGLYFPENMIKSIPERLKGKVTQEEFDQFVKKVAANYNKYINIGVRIEDDILITENGNRNLSLAIPKELDEIEKILK